LGEKKSYSDALDEALKAFRARDGADAAEKAGASHDAGNGETTLALMGNTFLVSAGGDCVVFEEGRGEARPLEKIIILHYLGWATGAPLENRPVAFREIPGCAFYNTTFHAHTVMALIRAFGNDEESFEKACASLGGVRTPGSGLSMTIPALPRVPVTLTYWAGEEEMPPGAQLLFDGSVVHYLPTEDIAVLGESLVNRVLEVVGKGRDGSLYEYGT
jgi:hypothetical protein